MYLSFTFSHFLSISLCLCECGLLLGSIKHSLHMGCAIIGRIMLIIVVWQLVAASVGSSSSYEWAERSARAHQTERWARAGSAESVERRMYVIRLYDLSHTTVHKPSSTRSSKNTAHCRWIGQIWHTAHPTHRSVWSYQIFRTEYVLCALF